MFAEHSNLFACGSCRIKVIKLECKANGHRAIIFGCLSTVQPPTSGDYNLK